MCLWPGSRKEDWRLCNLLGAAKVSSIIVFMNSATSSASSRDLSRACRLGETGTLLSASDACTGRWCLSLVLPSGSMPLGHMSGSTGWPCADSPVVFVCEVVSMSSPLWTHPASHFHSAPHMVSAYSRRSVRRKHCAELEFQSLEGPLK